jgi:hypothetical protein
MKKISACFFAVIGLGLMSSLSAMTPFCAGFSEGFKSVKGDMVLVPMCPLEPLTPLGSTPFREGLKAGIIAASK